MSGSTDPLLNQIYRKIRSSEIVFFLGAGVSKSVNNRYPTGQELKDELLKELGQQVSSKKPLQYIAQVYEQTYSRKDLVKFIRKRISIPGSLSHVHQIISLFPVNIITSNYDTLIEDNLDEIFGHDRYNLIIEDSDIVFSKPGRVLIKMHGTIARGDKLRRIVITEKDYNEFRRHNKLTESYLKIMLSDSILYLGYSISDNDFLELQHEVREYQKESSPQSYVLMQPSSKSKTNRSLGKDVHVVYSDLSAFIEKLFYKVYFTEMTQYLPVRESSAKTQSNSKYERALLTYLKEDQFDSGLWGKSIKYLFKKCFKLKEVPAEYRNMGSFSATDAVVRDLMTSGASKIWRQKSILQTIEKKRDIFGGVGLTDRIDINKFSVGQLKIDSNIRHTCAVVNISLLLDQFEDALLSLQWLYQFENYWVDPADGKMPINIACLLDCIDHARSNTAFAKFCYSRPKDFQYISHGFIKWDEKRNALLTDLNKFLGSVEQLWVLRDADAKLLDSTKIYITLFILMRLNDYPLLYPREFCQIILCLYRHRRGMGLPISPDSRETWDIGATGTFLNLVMRQEARDVLRNGLPSEKYAEFTSWCQGAYNNLLTTLLSSRKHITSFAEIMSPILSLLRLNKPS